MYTNALSPYMSVKHAHIFLGAGVTDSFEHPCGCWEMNPAPLQEQLVFFTSQLALQYRKNSSALKKKSLNVACILPRKWNLNRLFYPYLVGLQCNKDFQSSSP